MRLFVAIPLPDAVQKAIGRLIDALREIPGARGTFPKPTNSHITVQFLGDIAEAHLPRLHEELGRTAALIPAPPPLRLEQIGAFPDFKRPRTIWVGGIADEQLLQLAESVRDACLRAGTPGDDKRFAAHVTLMRVKEISDAKTWQAGVMRLQFAPQTIDIREFALFRSDLSSAGPTYTALHAWRLTGASATDNS